MSVSGFPPPHLGHLGVQICTFLRCLEPNSSGNARRVLISDTMYLYRCLNTFLQILKIFDTLVVPYDTVTLSKFQDFALFFS